MLILTAVLACGFALIHLFIGKLRFLESTPRNRWLSFAGGVAVAYVFLHILPELTSHQETFAEALAVEPRQAETWVYLVAMIGLAVFYGLERAAKASRARTRDRGQGDRMEAGAFWLHIGSFALYNLLIGYLLLHREETGLPALALYFIAMALHFVTNDFGLRHDHKEHYDHLGRWIIAAGVLAGWGIGAVTSLPEIAVGLLFAFVAGGVVLNVLKEELPEERESRFLPFLFGTAGYAALLLAV